MEVEDDDEEGDDESSYSGSEDEDDGEEEDEEPAGAQSGSSQTGAASSSAAAAASTSGAGAQQQAPPQPQQTFPTWVLEKTKRELQEYIEGANTARTDGKKWKKTGNVSDLRAILVRVSAGEAPPKRSRGKSGRPSTSKPKRARAGSAPNDALSRRADVFIVPTDVRALTESEALDKFVARDAAVELRDFGRRVERLSLGAAGRTPAQRAALLFLVLAPPFLDAVLKVNVNSNLPGSARRVDDAEMRAFAATAFVLVQFNGSLDRRFELAVKTWRPGGSAQLLDKVRFCEIAAALSLVARSETSLASATHPSRNAEAFGAADDAFSRSMRPLALGISGGSYVLDDDVNKGKAKSAKVLADVQVTDRKGEAVSTNAIAWATGGIPVMNRYVRPDSVADDPATRTEQFVKMLDEVVDARSERGINVVMDRGYLTMRLLAPFEDMRNVSIWGPLRDRARDGVPLVRVGPDAHGAGGTTPAVSAPAVVSTLPATSAAPTTTPAAPSTTSATSASQSSSSASLDAPSVALAATTAPPSTTHVAPPAGAPAAATPAPPADTLPRGVHRLSPDSPPSSLSRFASTGPDGQVRLVRTNTMGDGTYAAGRVNNGTFIGTALSTEHGTRHSKTCFTTPMGAVMGVERFASLANAYVLVPKKGVDFSRALFVPESCVAQQSSDTRRVRDAMLPNMRARPLTATDCTSDWFALRVLSVSGTMTVSAYNDIVAECRNVLQQLGTGTAPAGAPTAAALEQLLVVLRASDGDLTETEHAAVAEEDERALEARAAAAGGAESGVGDESDDDAGGVPVHEDPDVATGAGADGDERAVPDATGSAPLAGASAGSSTGATSPPNAPPAIPTTATGAAGAPAGAASAAPVPRRTVVLRKFVAGWFRGHFTGRYLRFGKDCEAAVAEAIAQFAFRKASASIGLGESVEVLGWSATPDGVGLELVRPLGAPPDDEPVLVLVLDEGKSHLSPTTYGAAVAAGQEFKEHMDAQVAVPIDMSTPEAVRAVPSRAHLLQILTQMGVWRVFYERYTVSSARGIIYSVLLWLQADVLAAFVFVVGRVLGPVLAPFAPLYEFNDTVDDPDVIRNIMTALVAQHPALTPEELALVESHLPRSVAIRRKVPRAAPFQHTIYPVHVIKNGLAWHYNILKGGVDRVSQYVVRLVQALEFWPQTFSWESKTALRRLLMLAVASLQAGRVDAASMSFLADTSRFDTFRNNLARQGHIIDDLVDMGLALADTSVATPVLGHVATESPDAVLPISAAVTAATRSTSALLALRGATVSSRARWEATPAPALAGSGGGASGGASGSGGTVASTSGSVESLRAAAEEATPLSKARYQFAVVIATGLARPGLSEDDPDMRALTAGTVGALVRALDQVQGRSRAPALASFDATYSALRQSKLLDHVLVALEADTRCTMCSEVGGRDCAQGRCKICRIALCHACMPRFHSLARVSAAESAGAASGKLVL